MDQEQHTEGNPVSSNADTTSSHAQGDTETSATTNSAAQASSATTAAAPGVSEGVPQHKTFAIIGYILPFLFFLPLINDESKHDAFARFHANQHLILLIAVVGIYMLHNILYMMFMFASFGYIIMQIVNIAWLVFVILGVINAAKGHMKELPFIGGFTLIDVQE